jgi:hypothetical protein
VAGPPSPAIPRGPDHPAAALLLAAAACVGTAAEDDVVAAARRLGSSGLEDRSQSLWVMELLGQVGLAGWWAAGFDAQVVAALRDEFPAMVDALWRPLVMTVVEQREPFTCAVTGQSRVGRAVRLDVRREPAPAPRFIAAHAVAGLLDTWLGETHPCLVEELPVGVDQGLLPSRVADPIGMAPGLFGLAVMETDRPFTCPLTGRAWTGRCPGPAASQ